MTSFMLVKCNCPEQQTALNIAKQLIDLKLAACVNIMPGALSVYQWQGKLEQDTEYQLQIKTSAELYPLLQAKVIELHPYDIPEIIALPIIDGHQPYLDWIQENLRAL